MWPEPLLALGFNRGKTMPGGGCGSRSPHIAYMYVLPSTQQGIKTLAWLH